MNDDLFTQYKNAFNEQSNVRNEIDGELNRIAITHDNDERTYMCKYLQKNILKYVAVSILVVALRNELNASIEKQNKNKQLKGK